ncbi:MAG: hypothetical protein QOC70_307 [Verrucomicrobiota bacterium]|jgi:hypothetical protein
MQPRQWRKNWAIVCAAVVLLLGNKATSATEKDSSSELEQLRRENQQLKQQLAEVRAKLPVAAPTAAPSPARQTEKETKTPEVAKTTDQPLLSSWVKRLYLRKSVFDETTIKAVTQPAMISYVHPGNGSDSYAIDAGVAADLWPVGGEKWQADVGLGVEYHRNTKVSSRKDLFQTGLVYQAILGNTSLDPITSILKGGISFKNDNVKDLQAVETSLNVLPIITFLYTDDYHAITDSVCVRWQPFAGISYEGATDTAANVSKGHRLLARYGVQGGLWFKDKIELTTRYTARSVFDSSGVYASQNDWNGYFDASLTYWFKAANPLASGGTSKTVDFGIGLSYENGDNPELSVINADLLTLSFQAKF